MYITIAMNKVIEFVIVLLVVLCMVCEMHSAFVVEHKLHNHNSRCLQRRASCNILLSKTQTTNEDDYFTVDGVNKDKIGGGGGVSGTTKFNPLAYNAATTSTAAETSIANGVVSLRKLEMTSITNKLLGKVPNEDAMMGILESHREFVLEPIVDATAVQDSDSIYRSCASLTERYQAYDNAISDRIETARNPAVRQVLTVMRTFVKRTASKKSAP